MSGKRMMPYVALAAGGIPLLARLGLVALYVFEAIVSRRGQPDQSLLFWYLPLACAGVGGAAVGIGLGFWGLRSIGKRR